MCPGGDVTAPFDGVVMQTTTNYGQVVLKNTANGKYFAFMHMKDIPNFKSSNITKGTRLGTMSGIGKVAILFIAPTCTLKYTPPTEPVNSRLETLIFPLQIP